MIVFKSQTGRSIIRYILDEYGVIFRMRDTDIVWLETNWNNLSEVRVWAKSHGYKEIKTGEQSEVDILDCIRDNFKDGV